jgi:hypothetical protein
VTHPADVARLVAKFKIEDGEPEPDDPFSEGGLMDLSLTLDRAAMAHEVANFPEHDDNVPDDLDEVAELLDRAAGLLDDAVKPEHRFNSYRLERRLDPKFEREGLGNKIVADLRNIAAAACLAHRERGPGHPRDRRLEAAVKVLMGYWRGTHDGKFAVGTWPKGRPKRGSPADFVIDALDIALPGIDLRGLKRMMQDLSGNRGSTRPNTGKKKF